MRKVLVLAVVFMSSAASASSFLEGDWCSLTQKTSGKYVRTTDFTTVLEINSGGNFRMVTMGNSAFEHSPSSKLSGYISQGASGADMQPDMGVKFQEAKKDRNGNLVLEFIDGSDMRYSKCKDPIFIQKLNEIFND